MNALPYREPNKLSAGALALVVHGLFFTLLFFGFNWHVRKTDQIQVEMWDKLPETVADVVPAPLPPPPPAPLPEVTPPKVVEPDLQNKADIEIKEKKKKKKEPVKKELSVPPEKLQQAEKAKQQELEKRIQEEVRAARENERIQELKNQMRAEADAATQSEVAKYKDLISTKISHNIIKPPDVPDNVAATFLVIVLPGGSVAKVTLKTSSGNAAYDSAAERAIYKSQPLPLPQDASIARMFRELRLSVKP